ncbi:hypothetical protein [Hymenobacter sp. GOD-10R]|uniref:hypothetical protein n=1 Tax=Hymenobacter sp. GOD-10R TaxID=3093922 RepID=UPI002D76CCA8|nr:hypothetical protein [Hymenobacter sp. GOD-10R]WRQ27084.1 hypothetical protein SD425_18585 [Hymenobacter sp. GOD-10R]
MATTEERILLRVDIDYNDKRIQELTKSIREAKQASADLDKQAKAGKISQDEADRGMQRYANDVRIMGQEVSLLNRLNDAQRVANLAAAGSYDQLRARARLLTAQLNAMGEEQRENTEEGKALTAELRETNDALAAGSKKVGDFKGRLFEYGDSIKEALRGTGQFGNSVVGLADNFSGKLTKGLEIGKTAFGSFNRVLATSVIGIVILALGTLYTFLTRTQAGMDFVERKTKAVNVVFGVLVDKIAPIGQALLKAFTDPKQAISDLVDFIEQNLSNRLASFGVLLEAIQERDFSKLADGAVQLATGITNATDKAKAFGSEVSNAAKAGEQIATTLQRIRDAETQVELQQKRNEAQIEKLKFAAEDVTKATGVRIQAAQQAFSLEQQTTQVTLNLQQLRVDALKREASLHSQTAAQRREIAEEEGKLADITKNSLTRQIELNNKINEIRNSAAQAAQQANDKALELRRGQLKLENDLIDQQLRKVRAGSEEELRLLEQKLVNSRTIELTQKDLTNKQKQLIDTKYENDKAQLETDFAKKRLEGQAQAAVDEITARLTAVRQGSDEELAAQQQLIEKQRAQQIAALNDQESNEAKARLINAQADQQQQELLYNNRLRAVQDFYQQERNELEQARAGGLVTEEQYQQLLFQQELGATAARKQVAETFKKDASGIDQELTELRIRNLERVTTKEREEAQKRAELTAQFAQLVGNYFSDVLQQTDSSLRDFANAALLMLVNEVEKTVIAAQIKILVQAFSSADSIATFGAAGGFRAAAIIAGLTAATAPLKAALTQSPSSGTSFAEGGAIKGPGTGTSDSIPAYGPGNDTGLPIYRLSNGEHILTAEEVRKAGGHQAVEQMRAQLRNQQQPALMTSLSNLAGPQTRFANGGPIASPMLQPTQDGGYWMRQQAQQASGVIDYEKLGETLARHVPDVIDVRNLLRAVDKHLEPRVKSTLGKRKPTNPFQS